MRKRILVSCAAAVALIFCIAVTAFAGINVTGPTTVTTGSTIEIVITGDALGLTAKIETIGLEFVKAEGGLSDETSVLILADIGGMKATYTYKVTAAAGEPVAFTLKDSTESDGERDIYINNLTWSGKVGDTFAVQTSPPNPSQTPQPTQAAGAQTASPSGAATDAASASANASATQGPKTGDSSMNIWALSAVAGAAAILFAFAAARFVKAKNAK